jgi:hypothetical protein
MGAVDSGVAMADENKKPCYKCGEQIATAARYCHVCRTWQSKRARFLTSSQVWGGLVILLLVPVLPIVMVSRLLDQGEDFAKHRDQVVILDSKVRTESEKRIVTVGRLQNNSTVKWREVVIEVQYFDAKGELLATKTERNMDSVLLPNEIHAFQVSSDLDYAPEKYVSHKVLVRDARDAKWP